MLFIYSNTHTQAPANTPGIVGLKLEHSAPFRVFGVDELMDQHGNMINSRVNVSDSQYVWAYMHASMRMNHKAVCIFVIIYYYIKIREHACA
jgi:hypothetical protein